MGKRYRATGEVRRVQNKELYFRNGVDVWRDVTSKYAHIIMEEIPGGTI